MLKTVLKTWTELCSTFARLAAMVTNAEANIWAEELCAKMCDVLPTIDHQVRVGSSLSWIKNGCVFCMHVLTFALLSCFLHVLTFSNCFFLHYFYQSLE